MVTLEEIVPSNHLLRQIEAVLGFGFILDQTRHLYCADNGRPAPGRVLLFKALLIGYLFGIRSEHQLMREIQTNVTYRWFFGFFNKPWCSLGLCQGPEHSLDLTSD